MANILGISAYFHDSAAALIMNDEIVAAAQEERFTRIKHDSSFPQNAINYSLNYANINYEELDAVVFYEKPLVKFERILENVLSGAPRSFKSFIDATPSWVNQKLFIPSEIDKFFNKKLKCPIYFTSHHEAHQASAFFPSPFKESAILCLDSVGEWDTTSLGVGADNKIEIKKKIEFPHSLGLLYSAFTGFLGFRVNSGEYKLMGLAPYGNPIYKDVIFDNLIDVKPDGSFWLNQDYFDYRFGKRMYSDKFSKLFDHKPRLPEDKLTQKDMDIAASIQSVTNDIVLMLAKDIKQKTGMKNICLAGGCALNCVANGKLLKSNIFDNVWIQPASGDAGGALGAALCINYHVFKNERTLKHSDFQKGSLLGPNYNDDEILSALKKYNAVYHKYENIHDVEKYIAEQIASGKIIGHFSGRMEFGPRALGNRSILADARNPEMQKKLNIAIKKRESFRPFAPSCLEEYADKYFDIAPEQKSPYMLFTTDIAHDLKLDVNEGDKNKTGIEKLQVVRSKIPAITHVDYSARLQSVSYETNPRFWNIINEFRKLTDCPVIVNTSFNVRGEPIVCSPEDAYKCFMYTDIDILVLENFVLLKENQKPLVGYEEYKKTLIVD